MGQNAENAASVVETEIDLDAILAEAEIEADELSDERIATAMRAIGW
jgi:hypothetical protein